MNSRLNHFPLNSLAAAVLWLGVSGAASAAPTAAEIEQLGKTLTPMGAEMAGSKDGTIPAWTGGICKPPANYKPADGKQGYPYADPFAADKPLYSVNAKNMDQYADKLTLGTKELLKRFPESFRVDVYPTRRPACHPSWVYDNTIKRAARPKLASGGDALVDAHAQVPFPIPKTGYEVMWNAQMQFFPPYHFSDLTITMFDAKGASIEVTRAVVSNDRPYWDNSTDKTRDDLLWAFYMDQYGPAAVAGSGLVIKKYVRTDLKDGAAWSYTPGQRRVRVAPEFKYDTVTVSSGGLMFYDEINGFDGKMDKFDFKLMGKKEMLIQYNGYGYYTRPLTELAKPHHQNPDHSRWELHRVWVVEASLKPGQRHAQKKKIFYVDEDTWIVASYDGVDQQDKPNRAMFWSPIQQYEVPRPRGDDYALFDFTKNAWSWTRTGGSRYPSGFVIVDSFPPNTFTPEAMAGSGIR